MTLVIAFGAGCLVGLAVGVVAGRVGACRELREENKSLHEQLDAWNRAAQRTDLDVVTGFSGETPIVSAATRVGDDLDVEPWVNGQGVRS